MNINLKSLIAVALLSCFSSLVAAYTEENVKEIDSSAPQATAEDAKVSFWDMAYLDKAFIDTAPGKRKDDISVGELGIDGGNKNIIVKMAQEIADNKDGLYDSMLISHKNKLIFESYYARGRIDLPHFQASVTKAYLSLAIGRAIQLGHLTMADLNKPIVNFIEDLDLEKVAEGTENITLHQAMTMSSGIRVSAERQKLIMDNITKIKGSNITQEFLQHSEAISPESQTFKYQDADPRIVMQVLNSVVPGSAKDFIKNEVLAKIGITVYGWKDDVNGIPIAEVGSSLTSRDMLKVATLVKNNGKWQGEQIISAAYLNAATNKITKPTEEWIPDSFSYGYYWYQTDFKVAEKSYDAKFAWGGGEQYILTFEELDLAVVFTAHAMENNAMQLTAERLLPAFIQ
ncbi:serine hydrolase [Thalassotalea nanhaiensis]|uniref:Serine hydrolase n=1 Tax=Thalassotalea nanhaiensis TaxID=3065648 RepID=A0ABY9TLR7_9GAMM|nr:serine hydrolase [Colwelliaceae bacterium SQ345]